MDNQPESPQPVEQPAPQPPLVEGVDTTSFAAQPQPFSPVPPAPMVQPAQQIVVPVGVSASNPGKGFGIAGIILGVLMMWAIGLPLSIVSLVKSKKAHASSVLGIIGLVLNILAILGSIAITALIIVSYNGIQQKAHDASVQSQINSSKTITLDDTYTVPGGNAYWVFPGSHSGWTVDMVDQNGTNRMKRDDGNAYFTSFQGVDSYPQTSDGEATRAAISDYLKQTDKVVRGSESTMTFPQASDGKPVEFIVQEYTSTSTSGVLLKAVVAGRVFGGGHILLAIYTSQNSTYADSEWKALTAKLQINDGVY